MIKNGFSQFDGKNVLLLQGPIGPFFSRFAIDLKTAGASVFKINFNGGDWLFYRSNAYNFNQDPRTWPEFFEKFILDNHIEVVFLFGDCRALHQIVHAIASKHQLEIGVFEEGYLRPDYITLERHGVNGNSKISKLADFYADLSDLSKIQTFGVGKSFWYGAMWGMMYNAMSVVTRFYFRHYQHHRPLSIWQGLFWIRSFWRKWIFAYQQRNVLQTLINQTHKKYFLVALQVHNDAQIHYHSDFISVEAFISEVINSFAMHAPKDCYLVIKHHPMDRGFHHYGKLINLLCKNKSLKDRIHYVHDLHLPTLLSHAKGVVVVNSTVGLSALDHLCPVIACGNAIYDLDGLTYQGDLDSFWQDAQFFEINQKLYSQFIDHLAINTQINGNFYKRLNEVSNNSGINWF